MFEISQNGSRDGKVVTVHKDGVSHGALVADALIDQRLAAAIDGFLPMVLKRQRAAARRVSARRAGQSTD